MVVARDWYDGHLCKLPQGVVGDNNPRSMMVTVDSSWRGFINEVA